MLSGRPIGLKAYMNEEEMKNHLISVKKDWLEEGFSEDEVDNAILSKCHPLIIGYYWHRYKSSSERLAKVLKELGYSVEFTPKIIKKRDINLEEIKNRINEPKKRENLMEQFKELL